MSHFMVMVLVLETTRSSMIEEVVNDLLSPYDGNMDVDEYMCDCGCIGYVAWNAAHDAETKKFGEIGKIKDLYWKKVKDGEIKDPKDYDDNSFWGVFARVDEREKFSSEFERNHPMYNKPDPKCNQCNGTGKHLSTYNPMSKWDWWQIGGRWTGAFDKSYNPDEDPRNKKVCWLCNGTGYRNDEIAEDIRKKDPNFKCNGCKDGIAIKWPTDWASFDGDIKPVREITDVCTYAIVTPDGEWHERGKMGLFGMSSGDKDEALWKSEIIAIFAEHQDCLAVCVDCHI